MEKLDLHALAKFEGVQHGKYGTIIALVLPESERKAAWVLQTLLKTLKPIQSFLDGMGDHKGCIVAFYRIEPPKEVSDNQSFVVAMKNDWPLMEDTLILLFNHVVNTKKHVEESNLSTGNPIVSPAKESKYTPKPSQPTAPVSGNTEALESKQSDEVKYASQLKKLNAIGYTDVKLNIEVLRMYSGRVQQVIKYLKRTLAPQDEEFEYASQLKKLQDSGYTDVALNEELLIQYSGDVQRAIDYLKALRRLKNAGFNDSEFLRDLLTQYSGNEQAVLDHLQNPV